MPLLKVDKHYNLVGHTLRPKVLIHHDIKFGYMVKKNRLCDLVTVKISPPIRTEVEKMAKQRETGMSEIVRGYLLEGLRRDGIAC
jgi:hypothetical protein